MSQEQFDVEAKLRESDNPIIQNVVSGIDSLDAIAEAAFYLGLLVGQKDPQLSLEISAQVVGILVRNGFDEDPSKHTPEQQPITRALTVAGLVGSAEHAAACLGLLATYLNNQDAAEDAAAAEVEAS